jgi:hypothetical protein
MNLPALSRLLPWRKRVVEGVARFEVKAEKSKADLCRIMMCR